MITYDIIGPLPQNDEYDAIFVIVDKFTKYVELIPCDMTWTSQQIYNALYEQIFSRYGIPRIIVSDRDPRFRNKYMDQLSRELGIDMRYSTAYHPETDRQTERANQVLEQYLRCFIEQHQKDDWVSYLATAKFAYNNAAHKSTKHSPFFLEYGRNSRAEPSIVKEFSQKDLNDIFVARQTAQEQAKAALQLAAN